MVPPLTSRWSGVCRGASVGLVLAAAAHAADLWSEKNLAAFFEPDRTTLVALSPDGRHLAYTVREDRTLRLMVEDLDSPEKRFAAFLEAEGKRSFFNRTVSVPATLRYVDWVDDRQILYLVSRPVAERGYDEELRLVDVDGSNPRTLLTSNEVETTYDPPTAVTSADRPPPAPISTPRRLQVIGFVTGAPHVLAVAALGNARVETTVYRIDLDSGRRTVTAETTERGRLLFDHSGDPRIEETPRIALPPPTMNFGGGGEEGGGGPIRRSEFFHEGPRVVRQEFLHTAAGRDRWQALDRLVRETPPPIFRYGDADFYGKRSFPLGFAADPNVLYFASNVDRDTFGVYALDLTTGRRSGFAVERDDFDVVDPSATFAEQALVLDRDAKLLGVRLAEGSRGTVWFDPQLAEWQRNLETAIAHRTLSILGWTQDRARVLVLATGTSEPGRYFVCDRGTPVRLTEVLRRTPKIDAGAIAHTEPLALTADRHVLTGVVTYPDHPLVNPPPLVLVCDDFAARPAGLAFDRGAQALAGFGFLVVQINARGGGGLGDRHRAAIADSFDRAPLQDVLASLEWLRAHVPYDQRRVALVGYGFGGYLALHAVQLHPELFRCVVSMNGPADPARWIEPSAWTPPSASVVSLPPSPQAARRYGFFSALKLERASLVTQAAAFTRPILILENSAWGRALRGADLRDALQKAGREVDYHAVELSSEAEQRADVYRQIAGFLNTHLYQFRVDVGHEKEVP